VRLSGKLEDGTIFVKKGHDDEPPFEFKVDEGNITIYLCLGRSRIIHPLVLIL